jgi:hypothetical protein
VQNIGIQPSTPESTSMEHRVSNHLQSKSNGAVLNPKFVPPVLATQHDRTSGARLGHSIRPNSVYNPRCSETPWNNGKPGEAQSKGQCGSDVGTESIGDETIYGVV